jgi:hypothetical protein
VPCREWTSDATKNSGVSPTTAAAVSWLPVRIPHAADTSRPIRPQAASVISGLAHTALGSAEVRAHCMPTVTETTTVGVHISLYEVGVDLGPGWRQLV